MNLAYDARIVMQAVRDIILVLGNNCLLEFKDFLYVPKLRKNLISIFSFKKCNYSVYFNKEVVNRKRSSFIFLGSLADNLYCYLYYQNLKIIKFH